MKRTVLLFMAVAMLIPACATVMTGMTNMTYRDAPLVLAYSGTEIIRDQNELATLIVPYSYGMNIDGTLVKEPKGGFNSDLQISQSDNTTAYIVDVLPGVRNLKVAYDGITPGGNNPALKPGAKVGSATITGSYSGPLPFSWIRTSETTHTLKGGEIYVIGLKMLSVTGEIDLYPLDEKDRGAIIETRDKAQFQSRTVSKTAH